MNERINKKKVMYHFLNHVTEIVLILVVIALWISTDSFMKLNNWMNLLRSGAIKGLIALGVNSCFSFQGKFSGRTVRHVRGRVLQEHGRRRI